MAYLETKAKKLMVKVPADKKTGDFYLHIKVEG